MSSAFIRGLWGVPRSDGDNEIKTRHTIISEINNWMSDNKFITFYTYVFGIDNKSYLESVGIDNIILLDKEPEI